MYAITNNSSTQQQHPIQKKENNTGLPDNLRSGIENLSGISLDDLRVNRKMKNRSTAFNPSWTRTITFDNG